MTWRRIKLYLVGFGLGVVLCLIIFRGRDLTGCSPERRVTALISKAKKINVDSTLLCKLQCEGVTVDMIRDSILSGDVDFGKSRPQKEPAHEYFVTFSMKGQPVEMYFETHMKDSVVTILMVRPEPDGTNCGCR
ncbi:MAG TPA: hypothetical protein VI731_11625 [Bacteroidia bacterium]|nr:hypothetical protein [Bacteroidia bacterium]